MLNILIELMTEKAEQGIKWLLTISKDVYTFPRFTKNMQQHKTKATSLIDTTMKDVKSDGRQVTPSKFSRIKKKSAFQLRLRDFNKCQHNAY